MEATASPKKDKAKKPKTKPKKVSGHPKYNVMVKHAIAALKQKRGSSRVAILKYIMANYKVGTDSRKVNVHLKLCLRAGVRNGKLKQTKGSGAAGSFKLTDKVLKNMKKKTVKKPKSDKPKKVRAKTKPKKPKTKKAKSPKKTKKDKSPKPKERKINKKENKTPKRSPKKKTKITKKKKTT